jgi:hypothetical protein
MGLINKFLLLKILIMLGVINMSEDKIKVKPGVLIPWEVREKEYEKILGDKEIIKQEWERIEVIANRFIWAILTDF